MLIPKLYIFKKLQNIEILLASQADVLSGSSRVPAVCVGGLNSLWHVSNGKVHVYL